MFPVYVKRVSVAIETFLPAQPTSSSISFPAIAEDFREDLLGAMRAKVNISWERPDGKQK